MLLNFELREHVADIVKVYVKRHPVTGQANYHVGYASLERKSHSLIVRHQLKPSHIEQLDKWMEAQYSDGDSDDGSDTSGEGHGTSTG